MTVHLKSSCVSPIEQSNDPARGKLDGNNENCVILQAQVRPLEAWIEARATVPTILLGDFNRNLANEIHAFPPPQVRVDGSDPASPLPTTVRVRSLVGEANDGAPAAAALSLLDTTCPINEFSKDFCRRAKTTGFTQAEQRPLGRAENLGCRNPIGLDHVLVPRRWRRGHGREGAARTHGRQQARRPALPRSTSRAV